MFKNLKKLNFIFPTIISPYANVSKLSKILEGTIVMHGAIINSNSIIGRNCIVNTKALIEHDCRIGDNVHISTGSILNGSVSVGSQSFIGSGSVIRNNLNIKKKFIYKDGHHIKKVMRKVLVVSSSRADFGILSNLLKLIQKDRSLKLQFVITGSHLKKGRFSSLDEIIQNKIKISEIINIQTKNQNLNETVKIYSKSLIKFKKIFNRLKPDLILILGDRFEIYAAALSAFFSRIPIAHIHGGEVTLGSLDDSIRHSITKLSNFHFVTNKEHFNRVKQLGENPKNIFLVGSLSSENIITSNYLKKKRIAKKNKF